MTIREAITRFDALMRNTYTNADKVTWLSRADWMVKRHIIDRHEGGDGVEFDGYADGDMDTELLVPAPHDEMYIRFLEAQVHYNNGEYDRYNNAIMMFQAVYEDYSAMYTRQHLPISAGARFIF